MKYRLPAIAVPPVILVAVTLAERRKQTTFRHRQAASEATSAQHTGQLADQLSTSVPAADSSSVATSAPAMHSGEPADATPAASPSAAAAAVHQQAASTAEQESASREQRLVVHLAVRADLPGPLRGVCVDLDVPPDLGDVIAVCLPCTSRISRLGRVSTSPRALPHPFCALYRQTSVHCSRLSRGGYDGSCLTCSQAPRLFCERLSEQPTGHQGPLTLPAPKL